jgi:hypothetical protein
MKIYVGLRSGMLAMSLVSTKRDLVFAIDTCPNLKGDVVASGSLKKEFKGNDSLPYQTRPVKGFLDTVGLGDIATRAAAFLHSRIDEVRRDQFWDDIDMELEYDIIRN